MSSGGGSGTSTTTSSPPPQFLAAYQNAITQAEGVAAQPLQQYGGATVAGFTPDQESGMQEVENAQGIEDPYINSATQEFGAATTPLWGETQQFSPSAVNQYESPYTQQVVGATEAQMNNQNAIQQQGVISNAESSGAWGGDRSAVAQSVLAGQQQANEAPTIAGLENQGYSQALGEFNTEQQSQLNANQANAWLDSQAGFGLGNLGSEAQSTALTGASALQSQGATEQSQAQSELNVPYEQFMEEEAYPFQTTQYLANIAEGVGSNAGGTSDTTTTNGNSASSALGGVLGAGALAAMMFMRRGGGIAAHRMRRDAGGGIPDVSISYVPSVSGTPMGGRGLPSSAPMQNRQQPGGIGGTGLSFSDMSAISKMAKGSNLFGGGPTSYMDAGGLNGAIGTGDAGALGVPLGDASSLAADSGGLDMSALGADSSLGAIGEGSAGLLGGFGADAGASSMLDFSPMMFRRGGGIANNNAHWREPMRRASGGSSGTGGSGGGITAAASPFAASVTGGNGISLPQLAMPSAPTTLNVNPISNYTPPPVTSEPSVTIPTLGSSLNPVPGTTAAGAAGAATATGALIPGAYNPATGTYNAANGQPVIHGSWARGGGLARRQMGGGMFSPTNNPQVGGAFGQRPQMPGGPRMMQPGAGMPQSPGMMQPGAMGSSQGMQPGMMQRSGAAMPPNLGMMAANQSMRRGGGLARRDDGGAMSDDDLPTVPIADLSGQALMRGPSGLTGAPPSSGAASAVVPDSDIPLGARFPAEALAASGSQHIDPFDGSTMDAPPSSHLNAGSPPPETGKSSKGLFGLDSNNPNTRAALMGLAAAGFGMMSGRSTSAGQNIGQGALEGLQTYGNISSSNQKEALAAQQHQASIDQEAKKLAADVDYHKADIALRTKSEADAAEARAEGQYSWQPATQNDQTTGKPVNGYIRTSSKGSEPPQFFATNTVTPKSEGTWQVLNDPSNTDAAGNPAQFRYNIATHQATTLTGDPYTPGGAAAFGKANSSTTGTPAQQKQNIETEAKAIASYQQAPLANYVMSKPEGQQIMARVMDLNPNYQASRYGEVNKAMSSFGSGQQGNTTRAGDVAVQHLGVLQDAVKALDNGDVPALNKARNWWLANTGSSLPTDVEAIRPIVSGEVAKAVMGSAGALQDREDIAKGLSTSNSPAQLNGVIGRYKQLMSGQLAGLKQQYENTTGFDENSAFPFSKKLTDRTQQEMNIGKYAPPPPDVLSKIPEGKMVTFQNGQRWQMKDGVLSRAGQQ